MRPKTQLFLCDIHFELYYPLQTLIQIGDPLRQLSGLPVELTKVDADKS